MRVLDITDLHTPYQHPDAFEFCREVAKRYKINRVICAGDEVDGHSWSSYRPDPNAMAPKQEMAAAKKALEPFFDYFPRVSVCTSNHTERARKRADESKLSSDWIRTPGEALGAPKGWEWAREFEVDGVWYFHGDGYVGKEAAKRAAMDSRRSCVIGHVHSFAGIHWLPNKHDRIFGMAAGCLIDFNAIAFSYAWQSPWRPALGVGVVLDGVPMHVPMI